GDRIQPSAFQVRRNQGSGQPNKKGVALVLGATKTNSGLRAVLALSAAAVGSLVIAGLAHANNITVSNTAQLQNVLSSPTACNPALPPLTCPDTSPGASNTITVSPSTDSNHQYQPTAPLNLTTAFAGTSLTIVGPQTADANGFGAIISGQNVICPCPLAFGN